jgi:uncharacterized protein (DUF1697 family)
MGFDEVATYIQSGNVFFRAPRQSRERLAERIESELTKRYGTELRVVLLTEAQLKGVIDGAPRGFGRDGYLCDVIFLRKPLTASKVFGLVEPKEGVDQAWQGKGVLYFSRLDARASSSRLSRVASRPEYKNMTIRSWTTTKKLLALMDSRAAGSAP